MSNGHYDKAVKMTVAAGKHTQALEMAVQHEGVLDDCVLDDERNVQYVAAQHSRVLSASLC